VVRFDSLLRPVQGVFILAFFCGAKNYRRSTLGTMS